MKKLTFCLLALLFVNCAWAYEDDFPIKFNRFPSKYADNGLFPDGLISDMFLFPNAPNIATFVGDAGAHMINMTSREILRTWFPGEFITSAFLDQTNNHWYLGYTGYLRRINLNTFNVEAMTFTYNTDIKSIYQFPTTKNLILYFKTSNKAVIINTNLAIVKELDLSTLNGGSISGPFFMKDRGIFYNLKNIYFFTENTVYPTPQVLDNPVNDIKTSTTSDKILIQFDVGARLFGFFRFPTTGNLVSLSLADTTLNSIDSKINVVESSFIISENKKLEIFELNDAGQGIRIFYNYDSDIILGVRDFVGDASHSLVITTDKKVQGYYWQGDSFYKETNFNYITPSLNLFPEILKSNLWPYGLDHICVGTDRVFSIAFNSTQRKVNKVYKSSVSEPIQASFFLGDLEQVVLGFQGKISFINLKTGDEKVITGIRGLSSTAVKEIYRIPGTTQLILHQRNKNTTVYDYLMNTTTAILNSTIASDRDPIFIDDKMLLYSSKSPIADKFNLKNLNLPPASWNHTYSGINYIVRIPYTSYVFIQTNELKKRYFIWDSLNWNIGQSVDYASGGGLERIFALNSSQNTADIIISENYKVTIFRITGGSAKLLYSKNEGIFNDLFSIEGQSDIYLKTTDVPTVQLYETKSHSILEYLTYEEIPNDGIFSDGTTTNVYAVPESEFHTYVTNGKIFVIKFSTKRIVATYVPEPSLSCESAVWLDKENSWALGYDGLLLIFNVLKNYTSRQSVSGVIKRIYRIPETRNLLLHKRTKEQLLYNMDEKSVQSISVSFNLLRSPLIENDVMLVYSPDTFYAELYNLSSISSLPRVWNHQVNPGISFIVAIKNTPFLLVQSVNKTLFIFHCVSLQLITKVSSSLNSPRIYSPYDNTFIAAENTDYEVFTIDASGKVSIPLKQTGPSFTDVYLFENRDDIYLVAKDNTNLYELRVSDNTLKETYLVYKIDQILKLQGTNVVYYPVSTKDGDKWVNFENVYLGRTVSYWCDLRSLEGNIVSIREAHISRRHFLILTDMYSYIWNHFENKLEAQFERAIAASVQSAGELVLYQSYETKKFKTFNWKTKVYGPNQWSAPNDDLVITDGIRGFDDNRALVILDKGINYYYAVIYFNVEASSTNPQLTFDPSFVPRKDKNSCSQTQRIKINAISKTVIFTCDDDSKNLRALSLSDNKYLTEYNFGIADQVNRKIDNFWISDHPLNPVVVILTLPRVGKGQVQVEVRKLNDLTTTTIEPISQRDVITANVFAFSETVVRLTKLNSHYSVYDIRKTCLDGYSELGIENSQFCYSNCDKLRLIVGDSACPSACPENYASEEYLGKSSPPENVKVCLPKFTLTPTFWESCTFRLDYANSLNELTINSTLCSISNVLSLPPATIWAEGMTCTTQSTTKRLLQSDVNTSAIIYTFTPVLAIRDYLRNYLNYYSNGIPASFNKYKDPNVPPLVSFTELALTTQSVVPTSSDQFKVDLVGYNVVNSLINITLNVTHGNVQVTFGFTDDSNNRTTPSYSQLRLGQDGNKQGLVGVYSTISVVQNQNITFLVPVAQSSKSNYAFFYTGQTLGLKSNIILNVNRKNATINTNSKYRMTFGIASAFLGLLLMILL